MQVVICSTSSMMIYLAIFSPPQMIRPWHMKITPRTLQMHVINHFSSTQLDNISTTLPNCNTIKSLQLDFYILRYLRQSQRAQAKIQLHLINLMLRLSHGHHSQQCIQSIWKKRFNVDNALDNLIIPSFLLKFLFNNSEEVGWGSTMANFVYMFQTRNFL